MTNGSVFVRRNVYDLAPAGPEIGALRRGITEMRRRSRLNPRDPTGWVYQANIHGTYTRPLRTAWMTCQHGSFFFLSWHRMYLYWFERILRAASGDPAFALPYWNPAVPGQSALPRVFRDPPTAANPLYVAQRSSAINQGFRLSPSDVSFARAMGFIAFHSPTGSGMSFGGQRVPGPVHLTRPHGQIEAQPHDTIHSRVGGAGGWMADVNLAALDPIFWLHHANHDRLWKRWLDLGGGRRNPGPEQEVFWRTPFSFFDENGRLVRMTGEEIVDTVGQLGYRYDDEPPPTVVAGREMVEALMEPDDKALEETPVVVGKSLSPVELGAAPVTVPIAIAQDVSSTFEDIGTPKALPGRVALNLEDIDFDRIPGVTYEVYLNLPEGEEPSYHSPYYVGNLGFFGLMPHHQKDSDLPTGRTFDITGNVLALEEVGAWDPEQATVTFVMTDLLPPLEETPAEPPKALALQPEEPLSRITIGALTITAV